MILILICFFHICNFLNLCIFLDSMGKVFLTNCICTDIKLVCFLLHMLCCELLYSNFQVVSYFFLHGYDLMQEFINSCFMQRMIEKWFSIFVSMCHFLNCFIYLRLGGKLPPLWLNFEYNYFTSSDKCG